MDDQIKSNIQLGLLVVIAATVIYGTFIKEDLPTRRTSATPVAQTQSPAAQQPTTINSADPNIQMMPQQQPQQQQSMNPPTGVQFAEMQHDFGTIKQDSEHEKVFTFTNTGDNPLIIENARGSCGCTVPEWPREPIAPGETGEIRVVYKPGKQQGKQAKTVTITANTEPRDTRLTISAEVETAS